jgi:hypothetical protein
MDLATIHLATPIDFSDPNIGAVTLPTAACTACEQTGSNYIVSGFGNQNADPNGSSNPSSTLKYAEQTFVDTATCNAAAPFTIANRNICAGPVAPQTGTDSCQGDSGGPLVYFDGGVPTVVGVVSTGTVVGGGSEAICGAPNNYGVYVSVLQNVAWVAATAANDTGLPGYFDGTESSLVGEPISTTGGVELWIIIAAAVGGAAVLILLIIICCCCSKKKKTQNYQRQVRSAPQRTQGSLPQQQQAPRAAPPQGSHPPPRPVSPRSHLPPSRPEYQTTVAQTASTQQAVPMYPTPQAVAPPPVYGGGNQTGYATTTAPAYGNNPNPAYGNDLGYAPPPPVNNSQPAVYTPSAPAVYTPSNVVYTPNQQQTTSTPYGNI